MSQSINLSPEPEAPLVLVVDDSNDIREMVRFVLESRGYRVSEAENGQEALKIAMKECPRLILMDLNMPVLDGFGAARGIREITRMCEVPIVAISAHNTIDHRAKASAVGFNAYLTKPINFVQMIEIIRYFIPVT